MLRLPDGGGWLSCRLRTGRPGVAHAPRGAPGTREHPSLRAAPPTAAKGPQTGGRPIVIAAGLTISGTVSLLIGGLRWLPLWALTGVVLVYGIVITVDSAPTSTMITEVVDDGRVGSALAIQAFVETLPGIVAPVLFGAAVDRSGYGLAFQTLGVAAFVGVGTVVLVRSQFDIETSAMASSD